LLVFLGTKEPEQNRKVKEANIHHEDMHSARRSDYDLPHLKYSRLTTNFVLVNMSSNFLQLCEFVYDVPKVTHFEQ